MDRNEEKMTLVLLILGTFAHVEPNETRKKYKNIKIDSKRQRKDQVTEQDPMTPGKNVQVMARLIDSINYYLMIVVLFLTVTVCCSS